MGIPVKWVQLSLQNVDLKYTMGSHTTSGGGDWDLAQGYTTNGITIGSSSSGYITAGSYTYTVPVDDLSTLRGEVDNLRARLEEAIALIEKLEVEARYWHLKAKLLESTQTPSQFTPTNVC